MYVSVFSRQSQWMQTEKRELLMSTGQRLLHGGQVPIRTGHSSSTTHGYTFEKAIQKAFNCLLIIACTECLT